MAPVRVGLHIGPMQPGDIPAIMRLEAGDAAAWSREHLEDELKQPAGFQFTARGDEAGGVLAVLCGRKAADEAEILKLSVAPATRRQGIGLALLDFALAHCRARGAKNCFLELRASNVAAANLYEKRGFFRVGTRRGYYADPAEDAILMQLGL